MTIGDPEATKKWAAAAFEQTRRNSLFAAWIQAGIPPPTRMQRLKAKARRLRERVGFWIAGYRPYD